MGETAQNFVNDALEIERAAKLPVFEYERDREAIAEKLGVRVSVLDKLVAAARPKADSAGQGRPLQFAEIPPWLDEIEGDQLAASLSAAFKKYVRMADPQADTCALWVLLDWAIDKLAIAPRLCVTSPTKQCGKSTLLELLSRVSRRALMSGSITPAALFRTIEQHCPTLLLDENEKFLEIGSDFHAMLNQGHRRGQYVIRTQGDDHELRMFDTFCMVAFARNGWIPDDLEQRSIVIELQRRLRGEPLTPLKEQSEDLHTLARMCSRWAGDHADEIAGINPDMDGLINRVADNWRPLFTLAEIIGSDWPERVRVACAAIRPKDDADSTDTMLIADIKAIFDEKQVDRLWSEQICEALVAMEGHPWAEYGKNAKPISKNQLAGRLRRFKADPEGKIPIEPSTVWTGTHSKKGYHRQQFEAAWERYLAYTPIDPPFEPSDRQTPHETGTSEASQGVRSDRQAADESCQAPGTDSSDASPDAFADVDLTFQKYKKPASNGHSDGLTDEKGGTGEYEDDGLGLPGFLDRRHEVCGHCGQPGGTEWDYHGVKVRLHERYERSWIAAYEASRSPMAALGSSA